MLRRKTGLTVFDEALERMIALYRDGHRVVVSFSAGKDSTCCLEICRIAAAETGRLPVDVVMRDEEIMLPGTFEYAERAAVLPGVRFHWLYAGQPVINIFNREQPYWWVFDERLSPDEWVRRPPPFAEKIPDQNIDSMIVPSRFPPAEGKNLYAVIGLRADESTMRKMGMASQAWPTWFDKVAERLPGMRAVANYGTKVVQPDRGPDESWEQAFYRLCIERAPKWIAERSKTAVTSVLAKHARHATTPFPQTAQCPRCAPTASWRQLAKAMFLGDPFSLKFSFLPYVEPEFFRAGAGTWGGKPTF